MNLLPLRVGWKSWPCGWDVVSVWNYFLWNHSVTPWSLFVCVCVYTVSESVYMCVRTCTYTECSCHVFIQSCSTTLLIEKVSQETGYGVSSPLASNPGFGFTPCIYQASLLPRTQSIQLPKSQVVRIAPHLPASLSLSLLAMAAHSLQTSEPWIHSHNNTCFTVC